MHEMSCVVLGPLGMSSFPSSLSSPSRDAFVGELDDHHQHVLARRAYSHIVCTVGRTFVPARENALQRVLERLPEVPIEVGVDQRIQCRIEVSDPEQNGNHHVRARARIAAQRYRYVPAID